MLNEPVVIDVAEEEHFVLRGDGTDGPELPLPYHGLVPPPRFGTEQWREMTDPVRTPKHYLQGAQQEVIDVIRDHLGPAGFVDFCRGNVIKYVCRAPFKGTFEEDMAKAAWYARMAAGDDPREER